MGIFLYKLELNNIVGIQMLSDIDLISEEINKIFDDLNITRRIYLGSKIYFLIKNDPLDIFLRMIDLNTIIKIINDKYEKDINKFLTSYVEIKIKVIYLINNDYVINQMSDKALKILDKAMEMNEYGMFLNRLAYRKVIKNPKNSRLWFREIDEFYNCDIVFEKICWKILYNLI